MLPHPVFDVPSVMQRVSEERITMLPGPPAIYQSILDHPQLDRYDLSSLRLSVTGAAVVPVELIRRMRSELTFRNIVTGYGLTESTGIATMCRHDDPPELIAGTAGRAIPDVEVRVVDEAGHDTATGDPGEVVVRGYNVMKGYIGDPGATAAAVDADGWLHSGDIGVLDEGGNLKITDRMKDMFIVGGFNVYPAEIENISSPTPRSARWRWSAPPTPGWARSARPSWSYARAARWRPRRWSAGAAGTWPTSRSPDGSSWSTPCPSTPAARC